MFSWLVALTNSIFFSGETVLLSCAGSMCLRFGKVQLFILRMNPNEIFLRFVPMMGIV